MELKKPSGLFRQKRQKDATYIEKSKTKMSAQHTGRKQRIMDQAYSEKKREYERIRMAEQRAQKWQVE